MLLMIIVVLVLAVWIITAARTGDFETTSTALAVALLGGTFILVCGGLITHSQRDPDGGWTRVSEKTYTLAEGSEVVTAGGRVEIIAVVDDNLKPVVIEDVGEVIFSRAPTHTTVVIQEEFRDVGTAIFWWGEGQSRNVAVVR